MIHSPLPAFMPSAKLAMAVGLSALALSACGVKAKPEAGTLKANVTIHKNVDDPRTESIACLQQQHRAVRRVLTTVAGQSLPGLQVGIAPSGPTVAFEPTPGAAQSLQIQSQTQGAEVHGAALLYPNHASDPLLQKVEDCVDKGVSG